MKTPPIDYEDLVSLGMSPAASISGDTNGFAVTPQPPKAVRKLLAELFRSPVPEGADRMGYLRHIRDILVALADWTQATDAPLSEQQQAAWAAYRQALRDLPANYAGEGPIPWPTAP